MESFWEKQKILAFVAYESLTDNQFVELNKVFERQSSLKIYENL